MRRRYSLTLWSRRGIREMGAVQWGDSHRREAARLVVCQWAARGLLGQDGHLRRAVGGPTAGPTIHTMVDSTLERAGWMHIR